MAERQMVYRALLDRSAGFVDGDVPAPQIVIGQADGVTKVYLWSILVPITVASGESLEIRVALGTPDHFELTIERRRG